jgi:transposase
MSTLSVALHLPFRRVRVVSQSLVEGRAPAVLTLVPDRRFAPLCSGCGQVVRSVHSERRRWIRDLSLGEHEVLLELVQRRLRCSACEGTRMEAHDFVDSHRRVTKRLTRYISDLCRLLSVSAAARHLGLDWKLIKACDKAVLEAEVGGTQTSGLRLLAVDEIALRKHQHYMTVVLDYESGRVVWMGEGRRFETLGAFFQLMTPAERRGIEAVAMDMWKPYAKAVRVYLPNARIIYDLFHVMANYNQHVLDAVRIAAYRKVRDAEERKVIKGTRFILYKNDRNLTESERPRLQSLLDMNAEIATAHVLKDALKEIWTLRRPWDARRALERWCALAVESRIPALIRFAAQLQRHKRGIIAHARFPINTGRLEGTNNRIKVIKRIAYGFHDPDYFALKVKQAFPGHALCT